MSVDLDRQLREYCRQMDEHQGFIALHDILNRAQVVPVIPQQADRQPTPRPAWVAAALVVLITLIGTWVLATTDLFTDPSDQPTTTSAPEAPVSSLPALGMPGRSPYEPAGEYGWNSDQVTRAWMHRVILVEPGVTRQTQLAFAVRDNCFAGPRGEPESVTLTWLEGVYLEPYNSYGGYWSPSYPGGGEMTGAYALRVSDRTLCVYLRWEAATTPAELQSAREVVDSIRGEPMGEKGIRINFTLPAGWDTG